MCLPYFLSPKYRRAAIVVLRHVVVHVYVLRHERDVIIVRPSCVIVGGRWQKRQKIFPFATSYNPTSVYFFPERKPPFRSLKYIEDGAVENKRVKMRLDGSGGSWIRTN